MQHSYFRLGSLLVLSVAFLTGCTLGPTRPGQPVYAGATSGQARSACQWNPASCMYKGSYEPGEDVYAEQEAARLNRAEAARLGRRLF